MLKDKNEERVNVCSIGEGLEKNVKKEGVCI